MKAFNYNINFVSQPTLSNSSIDPLLETIKIVQTNEPLDCSEFIYCSKYEEEGDSRLVRYCAEREFSQCLKPGCTWTLEIQNIVTFIWKIENSTIIYKPHTLFTPNQLHFWVLYLLLPFKFTLEDKYDIFHFGAVEVEDVCIAFAANSNGGKSTLTDYFVQKGHAMFSDDSLGIFQRDGTYFAVPSYPYIRPYRKTEDIGYFLENVAKESKPIRAIYFLKKSKPDVPILIEEVTGLEKFKLLHQRSFNKLKFLNRDLFKKQCKMLSNIPCYSITLPWDKKRLEEVKSIILNMPINN